jgi:hypothetical protein
MNKPIVCMIVTLFSFFSAANAAAQTGEAGKTTCTLEMSWRSLGHVTRVGRQGLGLPKDVEALAEVPGVYRFFLRRPAPLEPAVYVGDSGNLKKRLSQYAQRGRRPVRLNTTRRVREWILDVLRQEGGVVELSLVTDAQICRRPSNGPADMTDAKQRILFERLGIYVECTPNVICINTDRRRPRDIPGS